MIGYKVRAGLVVFLLLFAGCATVAVDSEVGADGTVNRYEVSAELTGEAFDRLQTRVEDDGYDSVEAWARDQFNESRYDGFQYDESRSGGNVTLSVVVKGWDPGPDSRVAVNASGENVTYRERVPSDFSSASVTYTVDMPGEIHDHNADRLENGNSTAVWSFGRNEAGGQQLVVESDKSGGPLGFVPSVDPLDVVGVLALAGVFAFVAFVRSEFFESLSLDSGE